MLATLEPIIRYARENSTAVASVNVFGYEDALAVTEAAEAAGVPVILAVNKDLAEFMPLSITAHTYRKMAEAASVDVCVHLDHCYDQSIIQQALDEGFTSVMFDGSQLPLEQNIELTSKVVSLAKSYGATVEGEIGSVSYTSGRDHIKHELTKPDNAIEFARNSGIDVMAVSVGNKHRMEERDSIIDFDLLQSISKVTDAPLCIHGVSGIPDEDIRKLATQTNTVKLNVATIFRMEWGNRLRSLLNENPKEYDRLFFMRALHPYLVRKISSFLSLLIPEK